MKKERKTTDFETFKRGVFEKNPEVERAYLAQNRASAWTAVLKRELRNLRESKNMTQADVARKIGVSQPVISRIEADKGDITLETIFHYAQACDAEPMYCFVPTSISSGHNESLDTTSRSSSPSWPLFANSPSWPLFANEERLDSRVVFQRTLLNAVPSILHLLQTNLARSAAEYCLDKSESISRGRGHFRPKKIFSGSKLKREPAIKK